ncbi:hypothetical protein B0H11DRAFT_1916556 [Mycena galericulata]|nr:hypothetical protein B0H11DRAFT_1916556 [Mycena galericulata]
MSFPAIGSTYAELGSPKLSYTSTGVRTKTPFGSPFVLLVLCKPTFTTHPSHPDFYAEESCITHCIRVLETLQLALFFRSTYFRFIQKFGIPQDNLIWSDSLQLLANVGFLFSMHGPLLIPSQYLSAFTVQMLHESAEVRLETTDLGKNRQEYKLIRWKQMKDFLALIELVERTEAPCNVRNVSVPNSDPRVLACTDKGKPRLDGAIHSFASLVPLIWHRVALRQRLIAAGSSGVRLP